MAIIKRTNSKVIKDPLFTPVIKYLKQRILDLEIDDPDNELDLARQRYTGLLAGDLVIEDPVSFPDGIVRVCIVSRKTGFARADVEVKRVTVKEILEDFSIPFVEINDVEELKAYAKANDDVKATLLWLTYKDTYGVLLNQENAASMSGMQAAFGGMFFNTYTSTRESLTAIDYDTLESGTVKVTDPAFGQGEFPLFIYELVKAEAMLPEITSNLPTEITSSRGKDFSIPNTYWFGGVEDITMTAQIDITTDSGYTIPRRSDDKLTIEGETIFGATDKEVTDFIVVRVTHMYMGRPVKKTFRIKVIIEKDEQLDLTFVVTPAEITASRGDSVEVNVQAFFQGNPVTLNVPAPFFESKKNYGNLSFVETLPDGSMTYRGTITGYLPPEWDKDTELYKAEFQYSDSGTLYRAPAFVNMIVVKPEAKPSFRITSVMTNLRGFKDDEGLMVVEAVYGKPDDENPQVISPKDLGIKLGIKGPEGLIEFLEVTDEGVKYKLRRDSGVDGKSITDSFDQIFTWVDPNGVRYAPKYVINVEVRRKSVYEIVPGASPLFVKRYQNGKIPITFMMNGEDQTNLVQSVTVMGDNGYVYNEPKLTNNWRVLKAETDKDTPVTVKFEFYVLIDGINTRFEYEHPFVVYKYVDNAGGGEEPGENTKVVAVPPLLNVTGKTDEKGKHVFQVFEDGVDISNDVAIVTDKTSIPEQLEFSPLSYSEETGMLTLDYTKVKAGKGNGRIALARKDKVDPVPEDRAVVTVLAEIEQSRTFKIIEWPADLAMNVEERGKFKPVFEFAGVNVPLNDPNLKITKTKTSDVEIVSRETDHLVVVDNFWRYVGRTYNIGTELTIEYTDPQNSANTFKQVRVMSTLITFPPLRLEYDKKAIDAKIWDTGTFPIKLMAGEKDWTSGTVRTSIPGGNKYIGVAGYNWSVIWAEKTDTTTTVPLKIEWKVGESEGSFLTDTVFNLEAWDQITFGIEYVPHTLDLASGDTGEITASFVYKGVDITNKVKLVKESSTIPETIVLLDDGVYDESRNLFVLKYGSKRGGDYPMNLVFQRTEGTETISAPIETKVTWPDGLNIVTAPESFKGFYGDELEYPLVINISGRPLELTSPNIEIVYNSGVGDPISMKEMRGESLLLSLDQGGDEGTNYEYPITIDVTYTNPANNEKQTETINVQGTIRVSKVEILRNPVENVKVYDYGDIKIRLADERGLDIEIIEFVPRGTSPNISFEDPNGWYVIQGSMTQPIEASLPLTLRYNNGGLQRTIDASVLFNIAKFDGIDFKGTVSPDKLNGKAGLAGDLQFNFTYKGKPYTQSVYDETNSVIPKNLAILPFDPETGKVTYTLVGQANDTAKFVFRMNTAGIPPVEGKDQVTFTIPVSSVSSDETFTLGDHGDKTEMFWKGTDLLPIKLKYGEYDLPANAPGLKYTITGLNGAESTYVGIGNKTSEGIYIRGDRSNIPGASETFTFKLDIEYEVGAPTPKTATFNFTAKITMGAIELYNDDERTVAIWDKGSMWQALRTPESNIPVDHFELVDEENKYVELTPPRGYEIIGAEPTTGSQVIPMKAFYKVDTTDVLQSVVFDARFLIVGSTSVRFKVIATPDKIETGIDSDVTLSFRPVYKDQNVGSRATFKPELSTIPPQVVVKEHRINGILHEITFTGKKGGVAQTKLVFWSPDAGTAPKPRDVVELTLGTRVLGELVLEVGERDNLLVGKHLDTGTYKLELLFGLVPIDIASEISKGNLTITREAGALTLPNAFVLNPKTWDADSFDYELYGPVAPGQTVNVSDFLNVSYKFGGNNYARRIEVPMEYTSPAAALQNPINVGTAATPVKMWEVRSLSPVFNCADTVITNTAYPVQRMAYTDEGKGKYVWITDQLGLKVSVEGSEPTGTDRTPVPFRFFSTYRNWEYQVDVETTWTIDPWDGKTLYLKFTESWTGNVDTVGTLYGNSRYRSNVFTDLPNGWLDSDNDFKGLFDLEYVRSQGMGGTNTGIWNINSKEPGDETFQIKWRRPGSPVPGVEDLDYGYTPFKYKGTVPDLTITGVINPLLGGNKDVIGSGAIKVSLAGKNILLNDPQLTIVTEKEDIFKIIGIFDTSMNYEITAPLDKPKEIFGTRINLTYTNPVTGRVHKGSFEQNIKIQDPADYPKWPPRVTSIQLPTAFTTAPLAFNVTNNTGNLNNQLKLVSVTPTQAEGAWAMFNPDWVAPAMDQMYILGKTTDPVYKPHIVKFQAPFRGTWIDGQCEVEYMSYGPVVHQYTITPPSFSQEYSVDTEFEVKFNITRYGSVYGGSVLDVANALTSPLKEKMTDYFDIIGTRYDATGTYLKLKTKKPYTGVITMDWYVNQESIGTKTLGVTYATATVTFIPELYAVPNPGTAKKIFRRYNLPFKVMSGETDITSTDVQLISVAGPNGVVYVNDATTPNAQARINLGAAGSVGGTWGGVTFDKGPSWGILVAEKTDSEMEFTFKIRTSAAYGSKDLTVVQKVPTEAWDQVQFKLDTIALAIMHTGSTGVNDQPVYDQDGNLLVAFPYDGLSSGSGIIRYVGVALSWSYYNTRVAGGTPVSAQTLLPNQGLIASSSDGLMTYHTSGANSAEGNTTLRTLKLGEKVGEFAVDWNWSGTPQGNINGYPVGTPDKNRSIIPAKYVGFEPKLSWKDGIAPAPVSGKYGENVPIQTNGLMFGPYRQVDMRGITPESVTITPGNTNIASVSLEPSSRGKDFFDISIRYNNTGTDFTADLPITIRWTAVSGKSYTLDYIQKVTIKGTGTTDPVPEIVEITPQKTKMFGYSSNAGFKVKYNGVVTTPTYTTGWMKEATVESEGYIELFERPNTIWTCVKADPTEKTLNVKYIFNFTDGVRTFPMEAIVPFTIEAWDGGYLKVSNGGQTSPSKAPIATSAGITFSLQYKSAAVTMSNMSYWDIPKAEFEQLNPGLEWLTKGSNANGGTFSFRVDAKFNGKVRYPVYYTGPDKDPNPDNNKVIINMDAVNFVGYEEKVYFYPDDVEPATVEGKKGDVVKIPVQYSVGLNLDVNLVGLNQSTATYGIVGGDGFIVSTNPGNTDNNNLGLNIVYDNRGDDLEVEVPLFYLLGSYNGRSNLYMRREWKQKFLIKGTGTGDVLVSRNVVNPTVSAWQVGNATFDLVLNDKSVVDTQYKSITVKDNPYVRTNPKQNPDRPRNLTWEVYNGTPEGITTPVTFVVVITDGIKDITTEVTSNFTIRPYDGKPLKLEIIDPSKQMVNNRWLQSPAGTTQYRFSGSYKGVNPVWADMLAVTTDDLKPVFTSVHSQGPNTPSSNNGNRGDLWVNLNSITLAEMEAGNYDRKISNVKLRIGPKDRVLASDAVEHVDYVLVEFPVQMYINGRFYIDDMDPKAITGKFGSQFTISGKPRVGTVASTFVGMGFGFTPDDSIKYVGNSATQTYFKVEFVEEINVPVKQTDVHAVIGSIGIPESNRSNELIKVTQHSNLTFPEIVEVKDVTSSLGETGPLPFKVMDGETDVTSGTTLKSVSTNDYIDVVDGKWMVLNAPAADTDVVVNMVVSVPVGAQFIELNTDVKFTIKAWDGNFIFTDVKSIDGKVWDKGTELPFQVKTTVGGTVIPSTWMTGIKLDSPNSRVEAGPTIANPWKIVAGDQTREVTEEATYTVTINTGKVTKEPTQKVLFNIEKYDGVEFEIYPCVSRTDLTPLPEGVRIVPANSSGSSGSRDIYYVGKYKGEVGIGLTHVSISSGGGLTNLNQSGGDGGVIAYTFNTILNIQTDTSLTVTMKRTGSTGNVVGVDTATIRTPVMVYANTNYLRARTTTEVNGKFGDQIDFDMLLTTSDKFVDLTAPLHTVQFAPDSVIEMVPESLTAHGFKVRFKEDVDVATRTTVSLTVINSSNTALKTTYNVSVTQTPSQIPEIVEVQDVAAKIFDKGPLPFKVMFKGNDVTADCTLTTISTNSYVRKGDGNEWEVYDAATAETTVMPEFTITYGTGIDTVTLKQTVKFTIKGWSGKLLKPVADDSVGVLNKTGQIHIGGSFGDGKLYPDTTVDIASVDGKGIITVTKVEKATDDGLLLTYTGDSVGTEDITIRVKAVVDSGNAIEGSDFADVTVNVRILPATLTPSADFETDVIGDIYHPAMVKQSVSA